MVSVKDLVTSGLLAHGSMEGMEAGGLSGHPAAPQFTFGGSFVAGHRITEEMGKTALVPEKEEKGELSLGPMVTSGWKSKDYSAPAEESVSLVGKSTVLPETTSGGFAPHTAGVGQMKLEAPPQYSGKKATRGASLAHPDGTIHEIDVLRPY